MLFAQALISCFAAYFLLSRWQLFAVPEVVLMASLAVSHWLNRLGRPAAAAVCLFSVFSACTLGEAYLNGAMQPAAAIGFACSIALAQSLFGIRPAARIGCAWVAVWLILAYLQATLILPDFGVVSPMYMALRTALLLAAFVVVSMAALQDIAKRLELSESSRLKAETSLESIHVRLSEVEAHDKVLSENEHILTQSQIVAGMGAYHMDVVAGVWSSSPMLDEIFGIDPDYARTVEGWASLLYYADR